eukprot:6068980-Heterocapsa_arctica.AAC.1
MPTSSVLHQPIPHVGLRVDILVSYKRLSIDVAVVADLVIDPLGASSAHFFFLPSSAPNLPLSWRLLHVRDVLRLLVLRANITFHLALLPP